LSIEILPEEDYIKILISYQSTYKAQSTIEELNAREKSIQYNDMGGREKYFREQNKRVE
jgi:hypothetical protein